MRGWGRGGAYWAGWRTCRAFSVVFSLWCGRVRDVLCGLLDPGWTQTCLQALQSGHRRGDVPLCHDGCVCVCVAGDCFRRQTTVLRSFCPCECPWCPNPSFVRGLRKGAPRATRPLSQSPDQASTQYPPARSKLPAAPCLTTQLCEDDGVFLGITHVFDHNNQHYAGGGGGNRHQVGGVSRSPDGLFAQQERGGPSGADQL